jgi:hypothetical protein
MKPRRHLLQRLRIRIKPGGFLRFPPLFLERAGWRIGDCLLMRIVNGRFVWTRFPDERAWRIDRLRRRSRSTAELLQGVSAVRTLGNYRILRKKKINIIRRKPSCA